MSGSLPSGFLAGLQVIELSEGIAAAYCGRMLADAGAGVLKVEPPEGDPIRGRAPFAGGVAHPERSIPFLHLNAGKRGVVLDPEQDGRDQLASLLATADVLVEDLSSASLGRWGLEPEPLSARYPALVHAAISPFGRQGPYAGFVAEELTVYALGGLMHHIGAHDREPLKHGAEQSPYLAGLNAAAGVLFALLARDRDGAGQQVDVAARDCVALLLAALELPQYAFTGGVAGREGKDGPGINNVQPCADGYSVPVAFGAPWEMMAHFLDAPELLDPRFATAAARQRNMAALAGVLRDHIKQRGRYDLFHGAQALGLTFGLVQTPADLARCPQLEARGFWAEVEHPAGGTLRLPGPSYRASRTPAAVRGAYLTPQPPRGRTRATREGGPARAERLEGLPVAASARDGTATPHALVQAPSSEEGRVSYSSPQQPATVTGGASARTPLPVSRVLGGRGAGGVGLPLAGVRVLDCSRVWAMPFATGLLADMGAEVIKVEVNTYLDTRQAEPFLHNDPSERFWERSGIFNSLNRGKQGVTINLTTPEGKRLFRELIATADVLVENNRPGVMARLGLDYQALQQIRPDLIMLSNSGYGQTGPWSSYGAIALSLEPTTGLAHFTGHADGPPVRWNWFTDYPASWTAVFAVCGALYHRNRTGEGQHIDLAMYEVGASLLATELLDFTLNGRDRGRNGNRHPEHAPHGVYPAGATANGEAKIVGADPRACPPAMGSGEVGEAVGPAGAREQAARRWVAIVCTSDGQFGALCEVFGRPELARDGRFATAAARKVNEDALDAIIAVWTAVRDRDAVMHQLQAAGVAAGAVQTTMDLYFDPQLKERGFFERVDHGDRDPALGTRLYPGRGWRLSRTPGSIRRRAPGLGEHNDAVLRGLLGHTEGTLAALTTAGVISDQPAEGTPVPEVAPPAERLAQARWVAWDPDFEQRLGLTPLESGG